MRKLVVVAFVVGATSLLPADAQSEKIANWPQFRGADSTGVATEPVDIPDQWTSSENIAWKKDIPGRGWSSPIAFGDRVFLTSVVNLGESEEAKKGLYFGGNRPQPPETEHQWYVFCLSLNSGEILWKKLVHQSKPRTSIHIKNSFASETPVTDGKHVYVLFGGVGVFCFDFDGNQVWSREIAPRKTRYGWGTAASPVLHENQLIIVNDNDEESYLVAFDKSTGDQIWRVERDEKSNWATPFIWQTDSGTEIVTPGTGKVRAYDLQGKLSWSLSGMSSITIATPYVHKGLLFVTSGYVLDKTKPIYAIRPGAAGDISLKDGQTANSSIAWSLPMAGPYNPSTVAYDGIIYVLYDMGFFAAFDAATGAEIYSKKRIPKGRAFTSSPWVYNGRVFCLNEDGQTFVIKAGKEFELLHTNSLAEDDMGMATPAIVGNRLLIRTSKRLYCVKRPS